MLSRLTTFLLLISFAALAQATPLPNPHLTVELPSIGSWQFTDVVSELVPLEVTSGDILGFSWNGDAAWYGGRITGYRYGWDIADPDDPNDPGWVSPGFVPDLLAATPRAFVEGLHTFYVMASDEIGSTTLAGFLLVVTDTVPTRTMSWGKIKAIYGGYF